MPVIIPNCEYCNSTMKFFDEAWVEDELLIVASVICTNQDCLNSSVVYIHAQQQRAADVLGWCGCEGNPPTMETGKCSACGKNAHR